MVRNVCDLDRVLAPTGVLTGHWILLALLGGSLTVTQSAHTAIVSTPSVDARDNAIIAAPVYVFDTARVATGFTDFWDGTHENSIFLDQTNNPTGPLPAFTGTDIYGFGVLGSELGADNIDTNFGVVVGSPHEVSGNWVNYELRMDFLTSPIYALSSVIQVDAVPLPAAVWLFGSGLLGLIGIAGRKKA